MKVKRDPFFLFRACIFLNNLRDPRGLNLTNRDLKRLFVKSIFLDWKEALTKFLRLRIGLEEASDRIPVDKAPVFFLLACFTFFHFIFFRFSTNFQARLEKDLVGGN